MQRVELSSRSAEDTERAGEAVAAGLRAGDVVLVAGDVGTGKTTFVRGACRGLGVSETPTSPSFTIGRTYTGRVPVAHVDLFRLQTLEPEDPALLADYLLPDVVAFVEWPEVARPELPPEQVVLHVRLSHRSGDRRGLEAEGTPQLVELLRSVLARAAER